MVLDSKKIKFSYAFLRKKMVHMNLQLLYQCNFQCRICDFWKEPEFVNAPAMTAIQVQAMCDKLKNYKPFVVSIGGGEPLLHKEIFDITKILAKDHFPVMICNGWFVTPENAKKLFEAGMMEISISVDYASHEKHDEQRGVRGAWERAVSALKILHENRVHPMQRVHMITVIMDDNIDEVEPLIQLCKKIGVTYLITFYSNYRGRLESLANKPHIAEHLLKLKKKYPEFLALPEFIEQFKYSQQNPDGIRPCYAGKNLFNIDNYGNVTRCIDRLDDSVGNIFQDDADTLMKRLYEQHKSNDCGACWTSCRGSVESLMYGKNKIKNFYAYYKMTKAIPLVASD